MLKTGEAKTVGDAIKILKSRGDKSVRGIRAADYELVSNSMTPSDLNRLQALLESSNGSVRINGAEILAGRGTEIDALNNHLSNFGERITTNTPERSNIPTIAAKRGRYQIMSRMLFKFFSQFFAVNNGIARRQGIETASANIVFMTSQLAGTAADLLLKRALVLGSLALAYKELEDIFADKKKTANYVFTLLERANVFFGKPITPFVRAATAPNSRGVAKEVVNAITPPQFGALSELANAGSGVSNNILNGKKLTPRQHNDLLNVAIFPNVPGFSAAYSILRNQGLVGDTLQQQQTNVSRGPRR